MAVKFLIDSRILLWAAIDDPQLRGARGTGRGTPLPP